MARSKPDDESPESESTEPVIFEPAPQFVEAMNQETETPAGAHSGEGTDYPGQPRIPQRDEGPASVPTPEQLQAIHDQTDAAANMTLPRDPADFAGVAGLYTYSGAEVTQHPRLGQLVPGTNDFTGVTHPELLHAIQELVEAGVLTKG